MIHFLPPGRVVLDRDFILRPICRDPDPDGAKQANVHTGLHVIPRAHFLQPIWAGNDSKKL